MLKASAASFGPTYEQKRHELSISIPGLNCSFDACACRSVCVCDGSGCMVCMLVCVCVQVCELTAVVCTDVCVCVFCAEKIGVH